jgi:Fe-S cluster assembly protein SufD
MSVGPTPLEIFRAKGIPHRRMDDWKYTDVRALVDAHELELRDNFLAFVEVPSCVEQVKLHDKSIPPWAKKCIESLELRSPMEASAYASKPNGVALRVPCGVHLEKPILLDVDGEGQGQLVLVVEAGASATLLEICGSWPQGIRNVSFAIAIQEGARLVHFRDTPVAGELVTVETVSVVQERASRYQICLLQSGAKLSRSEFNIALNGERAEADLSGISVLGNEVHADITTRITHAAPNTTSRQLFKMVAGGKSRAIYQGKITVKEGAIGSDSRQTAKALLLSNHAEADLKPELEILADDVKCAHGAAVGDLDQDSLFYLRSRGIPEEEARALLIEAFLQEVIDGIGDEGIRASAADFVKVGLARAMVEAS